MKVFWRKGSFLCSVLVLGVFLYLLINSLKLPGMQGMFPKWIGALGIVFSILVLLGELFPKFGLATEAVVDKLLGGKEADRLKGGEKDSESWVEVLKIIGILVLVFLVFFFFGFYVSVTVCIFIFLYRGKTNPLKALVFGLFGTVIFYTLVAKAFSLRIWPGAILEIIPGILGGGIAPPFI